MIYLYFAGVVITFVIICSLINKEGWPQANAYTSREEAISLSILVSILAFVGSFIWPFIAFAFGLMFIAKKVGQIDIRFNFGDEDDE